MNSNIITASKEDILEMFKRAGWQGVVLSDDIKPGDTVILTEKIYEEYWFRTGYPEIVMKSLTIPDDDSTLPDIILTDDGNITAYVECYNEHLSEEKQKKILDVISQRKAELVILTNGITFETYYNSKYIDTMTVPMGRREFKQLKRVTHYYNRIKEAGAWK